LRKSCQLEEKFETSTSKAPLTLNHLIPGSDFVSDVVARIHRARAAFPAPILDFFTNRPKCYEPRKTYAGQQRRKVTHAKCRKVKSRSNPTVKAPVECVVIQKSRPDWHQSLRRIPPISLSRSGHLLNPSRTCRDALQSCIPGALHFGIR
jgi:hypothetical protein